MPRKVAPLTDAKIRTVLPSDKDITLVDGDGLFLLIKPNNSRLWRFKYRFQGKPKMIGMGSYPVVSLKMARERRGEARTLVASGIDPSQQRKDERAAQSAAVRTFAKLFDEWLDHKTSHLAETTKAKIRNSMDAHAIPKLGTKPVTEITSEDVLNCLRVIEAQGALEMARRVRAWISRVFRYGIITGQCTSDPSDILRGALRVPVVKHHAALPAEELPSFMKALDDPLARLHPLTRLGLKLLVLTALRAGPFRLDRFPHSISGSLAA
jgi:hypothetical protein